MSRPYRIVVQKVVEEEVSVGDQSTLHLNLDPVLPEEQLDEILSKVLERNGWRRTEEGVYEKERDGGESMSCDIGEREITTTITLGRTLREEVRKEIRGDTWNWREMREMTEDELEAKRREEEARLEGAVLETNRRKAETEMQTEAADRLAAGADARRREVNRVILEVMSEALKDKARSLGNVEQIDEHWDGEDYELTISVSE